jgi:hypothetical protein
MTNKTKNNKPGRGIVAGSAPAAVGGKFQNRAPRIRQRSNELIIDHTEPLGTGVLQGEVLFNINRYILNPAEELTFPWLASLAHNWERYEFHSIRVDYVPRCSTTVPGAVTLAYEPDPTDEEPSTEAELLIYKCAVNSAAWQPSSCTLGRADLHPNGPRYTRTTVRAGDNRISDAGILNIATVGMASSTIVGRVFITYSVRLFCPHSEINTLLRPAECIVFAGRNTSEVVTAGTPFTFADFGTPYGVPYPQAAVGGLSMVVPVGVYTVHVNAYGLSTAAGTALRAFLYYTDDNWSTEPVVIYSNMCGSTMTSGANYRTGFTGSFLVQATQQTGDNAPSHARMYRLSIISSASVTLTDLDVTCLFIPA